MQRHDVDAVSLTFGLIFLGIANAWLMVETGAAEIAAPAPNNSTGKNHRSAAGVVSSLLKGRKF